MKKVLIYMSCIISILGSFILGFYYCKQRIVHGEINVVSKDMNRIAIVNLDEGIQMDNEQIAYSSKLLNFTSDYVYVGLGEAQTGIDADEYAAYIIIPSNFSKCIESINGEPQQVQIIYIINSHLTDRNRLEIEERLSTFKDLLNSNIAYVYLSSVLKEFHSVQDSASTIMAHDKEDLNNIQNIDPENIFNMIDFSEMKKTDNNIKNVDMDEYLDKNASELEGIFTELDDGITKGQKKYDEIAKKYNNVSVEINNVSNVISTYNPLRDSSGNEVYQEGLAHLEQAIDEYNENVDMEGEEALETLKKTIAEISQEYTETVLERIQENVDTKLTDIQDDNKNIVEEKTDAWKKEQNTYFNNITNFVNDTVHTYVDVYNNKINEMQKDINYKSDNLLKDINNLDDKTISKNQIYKYVNKYIEEVVNSINKYLTNDIINPIDFSDYENISPDFKSNPIVLPDVEKLYKEQEDEFEPSEDITVQEDETKPKKISIDVDEKIEIQREISDYVGKKEEDIKGIVNLMESSLYVSKTNISNIINSEIISSITDENQKEIENYNTVTKNLLTSIQKYDSSMARYNFYDYVKKEEITKHQTALYQNITALGNAMNSKNIEYLDFINQLYQNVNENILNLQGDMKKANDSSKVKLNTVITGLKSDRESIQQENSKILGSFASKLAYTRMGTLEYEEMQKFMASPVNVSQQVDGERIEESNTKDELQLDYRWILFTAGMLILFILVINLIIKIMRGRKELKALKNE